MKQPLKKYMKKLGQSEARAQSNQTTFYQIKFSSKFSIFYLLLHFHQVILIESTTQFAFTHPVE